MLQLLEDYSQIYLLGQDSMGHVSVVGSAAHIYVYEIHRE